MPPRPHANPPSHSHNNPPPSSPEAVNHSPNIIAEDYLTFAGYEFSIDEATIKTSNDDIAILNNVAANVNKFLVRVTFNLWDDIDDKDEAAKINSALKSKRQLKRTADATKEVRCRRCSPTSTSHQPSQRA